LCVKRYISAVVLVHEKKKIKSEVPIITADLLFPRSASVSIKCMESDRCGGNDVIECARPHKCS